MVYLILSVFFISWVSFIYMIMKKRRLDGFYLKGLTSFTFIFLYAYGVYHSLNQGLVGVSQSMTVLMIGIGLGLVLGLIGDLYLEVQYFHSNSKIKQIKYGMIVFGLGHLFYLSAMTEVISFNFFSFLIGIIMTLLTIIGGHFLKLDFGKLKYYSYGYSVIIFTMVGQSIFQVIALKADTFSLIFMTGAIFFGLSDLLLAPIYFKKDTHKLFVIANLGTYYLGQILIALSIYYLI